MSKLFLPFIVAAGLSASASAEDAETAKLMETGKASFMLCAACHGMDAKGVQAGPSKMAPTLIDSKTALDDEKLAGVMTYVRGSFGNKAPAVTAADAKKYREQWKDIAGPVTRAKLAELAAKK